MIGVGSSGYLTHIKVDGEALALAASLGLDRHVPSCPEWNVADLVRHLGEIHRSVAARIRSADVENERPPFEQPPEADDVTLVAWYRSGLDEMLDAMSSYPLDQPCWSWAPDKTAGFWHRRMAHETAVHRWDVENATTRGRPIAASLAPDGVDEIFTVHFSADDPVYEGPEGVIRFFARDAARSWNMFLTAGERPTGRAGAQDGDLTIRGSASDIMLLLWNRIALGDTETEGEESLWAGWLAWAEAA